MKYSTDNPKHNRVTMTSSNFTIRPGYTGLTVSIISNIEIVTSNGENGGPKVSDRLTILCLMEYIEMENIESVTSFFPFLFDIFLFDCVRQSPWFNIIDAFGLTFLLSYDERSFQQISFFVEKPTVSNLDCRR